MAAPASGVPGTTCAIGWCGARCCGIEHLGLLCGEPDKGCGCDSDLQCYGEAGLACAGGACGCRIQDDCLAAWSGARCSGSGCGCSGASDCAGQRRGLACLGGSCGCTTLADCNGQVGKACLAGACGCATDADCVGSLLGHLCFAGRCGCNDLSDCPLVPSQCIRTTCFLIP